MALVPRVARVGQSRGARKSSLLEKHPQIRKLVDEAIQAVYLTNAMLLLGVLVVAALRAGEQLRGETVIPGRGPSGALLAPGFAFLVVVFGAFVANYNAGLYCLGFPLCAGGFLPPAEAMGKLQWVHRVLAFLFVGHSVGLAFASRRLTGEGAAAYRRAAWMLAAAVVLQVTVAAAMMLSLLPTSLRAAHLFVGSLVWTSAIVLAFRSRRMLGARSPRHEDPAVDRASSGGIIGSGSALAADMVALATPSMMADLVTLTKPRIISLLLLNGVIVYETRKYLWSDNLHLAMSHDEITNDGGAQ
jgi:hypothetical protein